MISPLTTVLIVLAAAAAGIALVVSGNLALQESAATLAVTFGLLAGVAHYIKSAPARSPTHAVVEIEPTYAPLGTEEIERALRGGPFDREAVVLALDSIERSGPRPELPSTPIDEMRRVTHLPAKEFRAYLAGRLETLENEL